MPATITHSTQHVHVETLEVGERMEHVAVRLDAATWSIDDEAVSERAMWRRIGHVEAFALTEYVLTGVTAAELIPHLRFEDEDDEWELDGADLPAAFAQWKRDSWILQLGQSAHPLVIDGVGYTRNNGLVCPLVDGALELESTWASFSWNNSGSRTYGPDLELSIGQLPGQGAVLLHEDDPDCLSPGDDLIWRRPRVRNGVDAAFALIDDALAWVSWEDEWHWRSLYEAVLLMTAARPGFSFSLEDWALTRYGPIDEGTEFGLWFAVTPDDLPAIRRRIERRSGRRFARWLLEGAQPNGLASLPHAELVGEMHAVPDQPGTLSSPDSSLADAIGELPDAYTRIAWVEYALDGSDIAGGGELLRARSMDAQLATIRRGFVHAPCRAIACRWENACGVAAADDAHLAWFVGECVTTGDLFSPTTRWHLPVRPGTHAYDQLLMLVADGITAGLWAAYVEDALPLILRNQLVVPGDPDDAMLDDGSPTQREDVLALLQRVQALRTR